MIDQDALNRLTIAATQRDLTDLEMADYLHQHQLLAEHIAAGADHGFGLRVEASRDAKAMHLMNAKQFRQASERMKRLADMEQAVIKMAKQAEQASDRSPESLIYASKALVLNQVVELFAKSKAGQL